MTVIATDGQSMAADSYSTSCGQLVAEHQKVFRLRDGRIIAACGPTVDCRRIVRYFAEGGDKPELTDDVGALILNTDGTVDWVDQNFELIPYSVPAAIGSGGDLALGALLAGANPAEAVKIACQRVTNCGGEVTSLSLPPKLQNVA